ncbi:tetratricopeptide repeat protein [Chryseobacterium jejuense]|uniref:tetratricopeptide repeat protein n=1 Tax=Chryseobacterium jejuense TaxID=445960 RepID=UPI001AE9DD2C|nr:tetratricopeptide repeat protein [Chryseobacterium jejuense]MBP2616747.1 tetratricopeptide (TPR) repeat protein/DNA-binding CsgD family transcriptional regulator [Chryseobacterium jejuense]
MIDINSLKNNYFIISIFCFIFLNSCTGSDLSTKNFDYPLLRDNETLRLAGNYDKCMLLNEEYLQKAKKNGYQDGEALCYINLSNICVTIGNYKKGFVFLKKAEVILEKSKKLALKARFYQEYGQLSKVTGLYKSALQYNSKALYYTQRCSQEDERRYFLSKVFANRADFLYDIKRTDSSLIYFHKALKIENTSLINSLIAKHHLYYSKQLDSTKFYIDKSLKLIKKDKPLLDAQEGMVYRIVGDYYRELRNYPESKDFYHKALDVFLKTNRVYNIPFIYQSIAEAYRGMGDKEKEREYENKYLDAKMKLSQNQNETINLLIDKLLTEKENDVEGFKLKLLIVVSFFILLLMTIFILKYKKLKYKKSKLIEETDILKNQTELLSNKVNESFSDLIMLAKRNDSSFLARFQEVYPDFIEKLLDINEDLSGADLQLCAMIKLNFSSKEIATYTSILHKSAQQKKYRLRKKLNVPSDHNLYTFFQGLDS